MAPPAVPSDGRPLQSSKPRPPVHRTNTTRADGVGETPPESRTVGRCASPAPHCRAILRSSARPPSRMIYLKTPPPPAMASEPRRQFHPPAAYRQPTTDRKTPTLRDTAHHAPSRNSLPPPAPSHLTFHFSDFAPTRPRAHRAAPPPAQSSNQAAPPPPRCARVAPA